MRTRLAYAALALLALAPPAGCTTEEPEGGLRVPQARRSILADFPTVPAPGDPRAKPPPRWPGYSLQSVGVAGAAAPGGDTSLPGTTLVLYDVSGPWGYLGELYAIYMANLAGHFGTFTAKPAVAYAAGEIGGYTALVYVGSTFDEPLPTALLDDVLADVRPVLWAGYNVWQLVSRSTTFGAAYGFTPGQLDFSPAHEVTYKGQVLGRGEENDPSGLLGVAISDPTRAQTLATATRIDGVVVPWAVRAKQLTYVVENPIPYAREGDRVNAVADFLFDLLAPSTPERHRALLRLEDVSPDDNPKQLKAVADYLATQKVPFCVATIPYFTDPLGYYTGGTPVTKRLSKTSAFVSALKYLQSKGGTILMHGYTHQYDKTYNPYSAVSGDDYEFYATHVDALTNAVVYDGPVASDGAAWAKGRIASGLAEFKGAGLGQPAIFEFPHYAASKVDYQQARLSFGKRYERSLYFFGTLTGAPPSYGTIMGQYFPYAVTDVYGAKVLPENLGNFEPHAYNTNPPRYPADVVRVAKQNLVVRDGFASTFFHPYYYDASIVADDGVTRGDQALKDIVSGIQATGYTFVSCSAL